MREIKWIVWMMTALSIIIMVVSAVAYSRSTEIRRLEKDLKETKEESKRESAMMEKELQNCKDYYVPLKCNLDKCYEVNRELRKLSGPSS